MTPSPHNVTVTAAVATPRPLPSAGPPLGERARRVRCAVCWAEPGDPCGDARGDLDGLHLGRYARARHEGLITAAETAAVVAAAGDAFTAATIVRDGAAGGGETCPRCGAVNWGLTPDGRGECVSCGYADVSR